MNLFILDSDFKIIDTVDLYESCIWTDRYNKCGDFEMSIMASASAVSIFKQEYFLINGESEHVMMIEEINLKTDADNGNTFIVSGRSLEHILDRRIIWKQQTVSGIVHDVIRTLVQNNAMAQAGEDRKIPNFIFEDSTDERLLALTMNDAQFTGDNLYEVVTAICSVYNIGFKIVLNKENQMVMSLYYYNNHSYDQTEKPCVLFSPDRDNLLSSNYKSDNSNYRNVSLVGGEGEGAERRYVVVGSATGLNRREIFTDARDVSSSSYDNDGNEITLDENTYNSQLTERGNEDLREYSVTSVFDGEIELGNSYEYHKDFELGDIVQVSNEYGIGLTARITEMTYSDDSTGYSMYPSFEYSN